MNAIELMMEEHKHIKRMLRLTRKICIRIVNHEDVDYEVFYKVIDFVRNYADKHHHNKEEEILFKKMSEELGKEIANGPIFGMLAEHDLGRLYMQNLEEALAEIKKGNMDVRVDVIANSISYTDLLHRHIDKEDNAIYQFGKKQFSEEAMKEVEDRCREVERVAEEKSVQRRYLNLVDDLEKTFK